MTDDRLQEALIRIECIASNGVFVPNREVNADALWKVISEARAALAYSADACKHRWHYHDGARHCFKCRTTVEGANPPPGGAENEGGFTPYPAAPLEPSEEIAGTLGRIRDYATPGYRNNASMELALDGIYKAADDALAIQQKGENSDGTG